MDRMQNSHMVNPNNEFNAALNVSDDEHNDSIDYQHKSLGLTPDLPG